MGRVEDRVAIVTGAGRGLGQAIAQLLAAEGAAVAVVDVQDDLGRSVAEGIERSGGRALFQHLDVSSETDWTAAVARIGDELGTPDVLVGNAMAWVPGTIEEVSVEEWRRGLGVMLDGGFLGMRAVLPGMVRLGRGSIVTIGSVIGGSVAIPAWATYQAAKGGIIALTRHVATTYGASGIRANSVLPGPMYTPGLADSGFTEAAEGIASTFPLARIADPSEVAAAAVFLASDDSSYITGAALPVDGGQVAM
jgi:NAD(P)-dependent dehydrogenase (short-subunit alcohol dehydrogenase family)